MSALDVSERDRLGELEVVVERGLQTFLEAGQALMEIRDRRLYRSERHDTFEDYCRERWGFSKTQANRLIQAAEVTAALTPIGVIPATESQARGLAPLLEQPEKLREVWDGVIKSNPNPTAADVRAAVAEVKPDFKPSARPKEIPPVIRAVRELYAAVQSTPIEEVIAWEGNARQLAAEWASVHSFISDVLEAKRVPIPRVLKGAVYVQSAAGE